MPSDRARLALYDIRDNIGYARQFVEGISRADFERNREKFYAVTRALEIISEAARRLPESPRGRSPELPWRAILGVGNIYRHDYDNVAEDYVWRTATESLEPLLAVVLREIKRLDRTV
jgi:uncharacterized protein with HEPN domain